MEAPENSDEWFDWALVLQDVTRRAHLFARRADVAVLPVGMEMVLQFILETPGSRVHDIAQALLLAPTNTSTAVAHLIKLGLIEKKTDPNDRRSARIYGTQKAMAGRTTVLTLWADAYRQAAQALGPEAREALHAALPVLRVLSTELSNRDHGSIKETTP